MVLRRLASLLGAATSAAGATAALLLAAPQPSAAASADPDVALAAVAAAAAWFCLGWLVLGAVLAVASRAPGWAGRIASALAGRLLPGTVRRVLEAALGLSIVATPVVGSALPAWADHAPPGPTWTPPSLDRPAAAAVHHPRVTQPARGYVVRPGDCLWSIARAHLGPAATDRDVALAWPQWYAANRSTVGANPGLIHPGQRLSPPDEVSR